MYDVISEIKKTNPSRTLKSVPRRMLKMMEEVGEASEAYNSAATENNAKNKTLIDFRSECVDVAIMALDLALTPLSSDDNPEEAIKLFFMTALEKWAKQKAEGRTITGED